MWKVRFFGIDDNSYEFLSNLNREFFSRKEAPHKSGTFVEFYFHLSGYSEVEPTNILAIAEKELSIYESLLKINNFSSSIRVDFLARLKVMEVKLYT